MNTIQRVLGHEIDPHKPLIEAGIDSLSMTELGQEIEIDIGVSLPTTVAFDYPTVSAIASFVSDKMGFSTTDTSACCTNAPPRGREFENTYRKSIDLAVVMGIGCRFAGKGKSDSDSLGKFWQLISSGGDAITTVPLDRWDVDTDTTAFGICRRRDPYTERYSRHGSFVSDIDHFDCLFFDVSNAEATAIDPQQRMILKVVVDAMYGAGMTKDLSRGSNTAVYVGICNNDHDSFLRERIVEMTFEGKSYEEVVDTIGAIAYSTYAFASNRVSHILGLVGASLSIDCASASALVAINMAATESLRDAGKDLRCIAASVNLILHHNMTDLHTARVMFPADGRCKTFDSRADGFERGEGAGSVILWHSHEQSKSTNESSSQTGTVMREHTVKEHAFVYICGLATTHKGGGASLRALRGPAIQHKVRTALMNARMAPSELKYIEASGLGEPYGDAVEVGAYQVVFEPNRNPDDQLVFGSIHPNIGHLDGCSGMASFIKACLVTKQLAAPPIVHFCSLHPLIGGQIEQEKKKSSDIATKMGHTWIEVDVNMFPRAFPMCLAPMYSVISASNCSDKNDKICATGVSSFGFGGTMAHCIVDRADCETIHTMIHPPFDFKTNVLLPKHDRCIHKRAQAASEEVLVYVENVIWQTFRSFLGPSRKITRGGNFFDTNGTALTRNEASDVEEHLRERLGMSFLPDGIVSSHPALAKLAAAVMQSAIANQACKGFDIHAIIRSWLESHASRQMIEPERQPSSLAMIQPEKCARRIVYVLANPRSGSTLTQLMLNANRRVFAPQELYLLHFYTMDERRSRLAGQELEGWIFEGLRKAVIELRDCQASEADVILTQFSALEIVHVYEILQRWSGDRVLVDKTPPYVWSINTLRRAETLFTNVRYAFVHRHPYANVASMVKETIQREWLSGVLDGVVDVKSGRGNDGISDSGAPYCEKVTNLESRTIKEMTMSSIKSAMWTEAERLWALGNANVIDFLRSVSRERYLRFSYEDLVTRPRAVSENLCTLIGIPHELIMTTPYTATNVATFAPVTEGGLGAGDPHMLKRCSIDPKLADAWRDAESPMTLAQFTSHVAKRLGYRLPGWKEPTLQVGTAPEIVRLNDKTTCPVILFAHDLSGEVTKAAPLAKKLSCAAFGFRVAPFREKGSGDHSGVPSCTLLQVPDLPSLAAYYRHLAAVSLGLESGDDVVYAGVGQFGRSLATQMAAQQQRANTIHIEDRKYLLRNQNSRSWDATKERGCDSCAAGLLLLPEDDYNISRVPADIRALYDVVQNEINMHDISDNSYASRISTLTLTKFENGLVAAGGRGSPEATLAYAESFRYADKNLESCKKSGHANTACATWDDRVHRALCVARRGAALLATDDRLSDFDGETIDMTGERRLTNMRSAELAEAVSARLFTRQVKKK
jgi:3-oxoacyl-(acyl-carrier-protein) synthase/acyl carrier protein